MIVVVGGVAVVAVVAGCCWMLLDVAGCCWMLLDVAGRCWMLLDVAGTTLHHCCCVAVVDGIFPRIAATFWQQ